MVSFFLQPAHKVFLHELVPLCGGILRVVGGDGLAVAQHLPYGHRQRVGHFLQHTDLHGAVDDLFPQVGEVLEPQSPREVMLVHASVLDAFGDGVYWLQLVACLVVAAREQKHQGASREYREVSYIV